MCERGSYLLSLIIHLTISVPYCKSTLSCRYFAPLGNNGNAMSIRQPEVASEQSIIRLLRTSRLPNANSQVKLPPPALTR